MDFSYYLFAFYVFILALAVVLIAKRVKGAESKALKEAKQKEANLFKLYQNLEEMINAAEEYISESKQDIAKEKENISKITSETRNNDAVNYSKENSFLKAKQALKETEKDTAEVERKSRDNYLPKSKNEQVISLLKRGRSKEEISQEMGVTLSEVSLIIGLEKK